MNILLRNNAGAMLAPVTVSDNVVFSDDKSLAEKWSEKQGTLTAGTGILINTDNQVSANVTTEEWEFVLEDGSTVTRTVVLPNWS